MRESLTYNHTPRIGLIDIETAPINADVWGLFDQNVGLNQINLEWSILSFTFKELGAPKRDILYLDTRGNPRDDSDLLPVLWYILHEFDFLIAQNGKRFDIRKIAARMLMAGYPPFRPVKIIDTMLMARQVAGFTSNKLAWLAEYLGNIPKSEHKLFPGHELWRECLKDNPVAWEEMRKYNAVDVLAMEPIYMRLRPWAAGHPNVAVYTDHDELACPVCGSTDLHKDDETARTNTGEYHRYICGNCDAWSRSRYTINSIQKRRALLTNLGAH